MVAFGGDDGDVGATADDADAVVVGVVAPVGTDVDDSVGVVDGGGEFSVDIVLADPRPIKIEKN